MIQIHKISITYFNKDYSCDKTIQNLIIYIIVRTHTYYSKLFSTADCHIHEYLNNNVEKKTFLKIHLITKLS